MHNINKKIACCRARINDNLTPVSTGLTISMEDFYKACSLRVCSHGVPKSPVGVFSMLGEKGNPKCRDDLTLCGNSAISRQLSQCAGTYVK